MVWKRVCAWISVLVILLAMFWLCMWLLEAIPLWLDALYEAVEQRIQETLAEVLGNLIDETLNFTAPLPG